MESCIRDLWNGYFPYLQTDYPPANGPKAWETAIPSI